MSINLDDYVEVNERIETFREKYPNGCLQAEILSMPTANVPFVTVRAYAYRNPDDPRPGTGLAWEPWPGKTPYTKDSELQNAETSAWGRAIVAVLAADAKRGVASREEVRNRSGAESGDAVGPPPAASPADGGFDEPSTWGAPPENAWGPQNQGCPNCGGPMWDNRATKKNPKAPDFKCKDKSCDGVIWPAKANA